MKVLFASDGSDCSTRAAKYIATKLLEQAKDLTVTLFYVDAPMMARVNTALGEEAVVRFHRENSDYNLKKARGRLTRAGVPFEETFTVGSVSTCVAEHARHGKYDLVVMGSHGRGPLGGLLLGSATARVLATCKVPVLVVP